MVIFSLAIISFSIYKFSLLNPVFIEIEMKENFFHVSISLVIW